MAQQQEQDPFVGIGHKPPAHVEVAGRRFTVCSFMPCTAFFALKDMGLVTEDGEVNEKVFDNITFEQVGYILKLLVVSPKITDSILEHSEALSTMQLFTEALNAAKIDEDVMQDLKQRPTKP